MALLTRNLAFFHAPRTGGSWMRATLGEMGLGIAVKEVGGFHCCPDDIDTPVSEHFKFTLVREPISWLSSMWQARIFHAKPEDVERWQIPEPTLLPTLPRRSWTEFLNAYLSQDEPLVRRAFEPYTVRANYIGKTENLAGSLVHAVGAIIRRYDCVPVNRTPENIRAVFNRQAPWTNEQQARCREIEGCRSLTVNTSDGQNASGTSPVVPSTRPNAGNA